MLKSVVIDGGVEGGALLVGFLARLLVKVIHKLARFHAEAVGDGQDRRQLRLPTTALEATDRGRMDIRLAGEAVLGKPVPRAKLAQAIAECPACPFGVSVEALSHR